MPQASAIVLDAADAESVVIPADHLNMIKFASRKNGGYEKVSRHLQLLTEEASDAIGARWKEQNRIRKGTKSIRYDVVEIVRSGSNNNLQLRSMWKKISQSHSVSLKSLR